MIATRGMGRNTANGEHGNMVMGGYGIRGGVAIIITFGNIVRDFIVNNIIGNIVREY